MAWASHPGSTGHGVNSRLHFLSLLTTTYLLASDYSSATLIFFLRRNLFVGYILPLGSTLDLGAFRRSDVLALSPTDAHEHEVAAALRRPALHLQRPLVAAVRHACACLDADNERRHQREHRQGEPEGRLPHSKRSLRRASSPTALRASPSAFLCAASASTLRLLFLRLLPPLLLRLLVAPCLAPPRPCPALTCCLWAHAI